MKKITAVIPIRKGSQRVKNKNLRNFGTEESPISLLELKIKTLKKVSLIDEIVVNTDSEEAIEIAKREGIKYHRREDYYASSACSGSDFFEHLGKTTETDIFIYSPVTSPFVSVESYEKCIKLFLEGKDLDCVSTVSKVKEFLWLDGKAINYDPKNAPNSQNLPDVVALNFGVTVVSKENLIKNKNIIGHNPKFVETSDIEGIDIDTELDFFTAQQIYKKLKEGESLL